MFERYSERARHVIFFARFEASEMGDREILPVHLLLGLLRDKAVFVRLQLAPEKLTAIHDACKNEASHQVNLPTSVDMPVNDVSKDILEAALQETQNRRHTEVESDHLLLAMLHVPGKSAEILKAQGITYAGAAARLYPEKQAPGMADYT